MSGACFFNQKAGLKLITIIELFNDNHEMFLKEEFI